MIKFPVPEFSVSPADNQFNWDDILRYGFSAGQSFILTSHVPEDQRSRQDIVAIDPVFHFTVFANRIEVSYPSGEIQNLTISPFEFLDKLRLTTSTKGLHSGGLFLAFTYEFSALIEPGKRITKPVDENTPLLFGMIPSHIFIRDIQSGVIEQISAANSQPFSLVCQPSESPDFKPDLLKFESLLSEKEFTEKVNHLKTRIYNGDTYEINFAYETRGSLSYRHDFAVWKSLTKKTPSSFFSYFRNNDTAVISSSPERFFRMENETLTVQPMKGTRKRLSDQDPKIIINELKNNEKDRAENLMIVDLMRNDLSKIAQPNSIRVESLFDVEIYKTVYQMISTVSCRVKPETSFSAIIRALFPPGSMTGAPKIKTMEIIADTEQFKRGFYSGIAGYFSFGGTAEFSVLIRCLELSGMEFKANFGGAIVADSDAENELEETKAKMSGILSALGKTEGEI